MYASLLEPKGEAGNVFFDPMVVRVVIRGGSKARRPEPPVPTRGREVQRGLHLRYPFKIDGGLGILDTGRNPLGTLRKFLVLSGKSRGLVS